MTESEKSPKLTIGAVADATGIPASTLRTWERRYGYPQPDRTEGGHRVYDPSVIDRLGLIREALDAGHRAGQVVDRSIGELRSLLDPPEPGWDETSQPHTSSEPNEERLASHGEWISNWVEATVELDLANLQDQFHEDWERLGPIGFLQERVSPYLREIGLGWAEGRFDVIHEHHASEVIRDFLTSKWRPKAAGATGPYCMLGALPGEHHELGLHMAAVALSTAEWRVGMIGSNVPIDELVQATERRAPDALGVAITSSYGVDPARRALLELRNRLQEAVALLVGGSGASSRVELEGVQFFDDLESLYNWAVSHR